MTDSSQPFRRRSRTVDRRTIALGAWTLAQLNALAEDRGLTDRDRKRAADALLGTLLRKAGYEAVAKVWERIGDD